MRQRQTWNLCHRHCLRRILRHPDRQLRQRAIGLTDGHSHVVTTAIATGYDDRLPVTGMKSVTDNRLTQLIVSIMKLSRRHRGPLLGCREGFKVAKLNSKLGGRIPVGARCQMNAPVRDTSGARPCRFCALTARTAARAHAFSGSRSPQ